MKFSGLRIIRPLNCLFAFLLTLFAYFLSIGYISGNLSAILAAMAVFLITGAGNTLNDFFDYKIDSKNKSHRPIPNKLVTRQEALTLSLLLFISGLVASYYVNSNVFMIAIVAALSLIAYNSNGRYLGFSGDILISFLSSLVFILGAFVASSKLPFIIILVAILAFTINLSREILKDIEDYEGDKGYKLTLPHKIGREKAASVALVFLILNLGMLYILLPIYNNRIVILFSAPLILMMLSSVIKVLSNPTTQNAKTAQNIVKLIMLVEFLFVVLDNFIINLKIN